MVSLKAVRIKILITDCNNEMLLIIIKHAWSWSKFWQLKIIVNQVSAKILPDWRHIFETILCHHGIFLLKNILLITGRSSFPCAQNLGWIHTSNKWFPSCFSLSPWWTWDPGIWNIYNAKWAAYFNRCTHGGETIHFTSQTQFTQYCFAASNLLSQNSKINSLWTCLKSVD